MTHFVNRVKVTLMMILLLFMEFVAFPQRKDALIQGSKNGAFQTEASGSMGLYYQGKCQPTFPNETLVENERLDWCSNIAKTANDKPWFMISQRGKSMKLTGYSIRSGCCYYFCCCIEENGKVLDYGCCCNLYSYSLQGSNDNVTWKVIHKVEKEKDFWSCKFMTYEFPMTESFNFIRFVQDEPYPDCPYCMQINQIELYGTMSDSQNGLSSYDNEDNDESVSIIGKLNRERVE